MRQFLLYTKMHKSLFCSLNKTHFSSLLKSRSTHKELIHSQLLLPLNKVTIKEAKANIAMARVI